jgi:hypothetical protein
MGPIDASVLAQPMPKEFDKELTEVTREDGLSGKKE